MNDIFKIILAGLLLLSGVGEGCGKKLEVKEIVYLETDKSATDPIVTDFNNEACALVKLSFLNDANVIAGEQIYKKEYHGNEWYIYMPRGSIKFFIKYPGYETLEVDLSSKFKNGLVSGKTYRVTVPYEEILPINSSTGLSPTIPQQGSNISIHNGNKSYPSINVQNEPLITHNNIYIKAGYSFMALSGITIGVGAYIRNFNIEANCRIGLSKSEEIYWYNSIGDAMPIEAKYSPTGFNLKFGYGIGLGERFRITPLLGLQYVGLSETAEVKIANNANALSIPIAVKLDFAIIKHVGLSLTPSYIINVNKSEGYKTLSEISNKIKGYSNGLDINISLYCNF